MPLDYAWITNPLKADGSLKLRTVGQKRLSFDALAQRMARGTSLDQTTAAMAVNLFVDALRTELALGHAVDTPLGLFSLGVRSTGKTTPPRAVLHVRMGKKQNQCFLEGVKVRRVDTPAVLGPVVLSIRNLEAPCAGAAGRPGEIFQIRGSRLSFSPGDDLLGIFFVNARGNEVRASTYSRTGWRIVDAKIPVLNPGAYRTEIRTLSRGNLVVTALVTREFVIG